MLGVECRRRLECAFLAQFVGAEVGVLVPQFLVLRHLVEHLAAFAVPFGVLRLVEDLFGHVARSNHRAGHDAGDLLPRPCESEDVARQHTHTLPGLLDRPRRLGGLRIVDHDELRTDRPPVRLLVLHATDAPRDARDAHQHTRGRRARNRRENDLVRGPGDPCAFALVELSGTAVGDAVEALDRERHLREVGGKMLVHLQLGLDRVEDFQRGGFACADQHDELAVSVQHRPDGGGFGQGGLARTTAHGKSEKTALEHGSFDLGNGAEVIRRPFELVHFWEVGLAEELEVETAGLLTLRVLDLREFPDVAPQERLLGQSRPRRLAPFGVGADSASGIAGGVELVDQPRTVFAEVDAPLVLVAGDAESAHLEVAVHLRRANDGSERR